MAKMLVADITIPPAILAELVTLSEVWQQDVGETLRSVLAAGLIVATTQQCCKRCGCTEYSPCVRDDEPCHWVADDLCSACCVTV